MTYYGGHYADRKDMDARVDVFLCPWDTVITYQPFMKTFRKTVLFKRRGQDCWETLQDRDQIYVNVFWYDIQEYDIEFMAIFCQETRTTVDGTLSLSGVEKDRVFKHEIDGKRVSTMSNRQRELVNAGIDELNVQRKAMNQYLRLKVRSTRFSCHRGADRHDVVGANDGSVT